MIEKIEQWEIDRLIPYARNPRKNDHAVDKIASAIREFGFKVPIIAKSNGDVVDGHLRLKAAQKLGMDTVPVVIADDLTDAQVRAFRLSVNKMAEIADWDDELLQLELDELREMDFDLDLTGFDDYCANEDNIYSEMVDAVAYEKNKPKPTISDLCETSKYFELYRKISDSQIHEDEKAFLYLAASRHIQFNYEKIAGYYAHSDDDTRRIFEDLVLVIIDYNDAIKRGIVKINNAISIDVEYES